MHAVTKQQDEEEEEETPKNASCCRSDSNRTVQMFRLLSVDIVPASLFDAARKTPIAIRFSENVLNGSGALAYLCHCAMSQGRLLSVLGMISQLGP